MEHGSSTRQGAKYNCDTCDYQATQKTNMENQKLSVHDNDHSRSFICVKCDYQTTKRSNPKVHILSVHKRREKIIIL